jgi:hypothetical protein
MKKIIIIAICGLVFGNINSSKGQTSAQQGGFALWYEFGNGSFINKSFGSADSLTNYIATKLPANNGGTGPLKGIRKIAPIYIPTGPPPGLKYFGYHPTNTIVAGAFATTPMPDGKNLHLHTSTRDFLLKDTLKLAINYKKPTGATKVALFYNSNPNAVFAPIAEISNTTRYKNTISTDSILLPNIRMYNGETVSIAPSTLYATGRAGNGYQNGLVFTIPSTNMNNIFLTLFTYPIIVTTANENLKLVYLDNSDNVVGKETVTPSINNSKLTSHDPNNELTSPECITVNHASDTIIHYIVHFQNTGLGNADSIKTITILPAGYTVADLRTNNNNLKWKIADTLRHSRYKVQIKNDGNPNHLYIEFRKATLASVLMGTVTLPDPLNDKRTMGEFEFDLKLHSNINGPMDLSSYTSIVFDNNEAVNTDSAIIRIRECCSCREPGDEQNNVNNNCCNNPKLKKWQQWLFCKDCD